MSVGKAEGTRSENQEEEDVRDLSCHGKTLNFSGRDQSFGWVLLRNMINMNSESCLRSLPGETVTAEGAWARAEQGVRLVGPGAPRWGPEPSQSLDVKGGRAEQGDR